MFKVRLRSSIVLMAVTIFLMVTGGDILFAGMAAISLIGMMELYRTLDFHKTLLAAVSYVAAVAYYALLRFGQEEYFLPFFIAYLVLLMAVYVLTFPKFEAAQVMNAFFGLFYVAIMISYIYQTRMVESGAYLVWLIFICSWGCDTMAYCTGMLIGKHKMTPKLSPKKSVEGGIGGVAGAAILGAVYGLAIAGKMGDGSHIASFAVICAAGGLISMVGDLAASAIKRNHDIKDYGHLIPGHGGILDRFDSVILISPGIYYLALALL